MATFTMRADLVRRYIYAHNTYEGLQWRYRKVREQKIEDVCGYWKEKAEAGRSGITAYVEVVEREFANMMKDRKRQVEIRNALGRIIDAIDVPGVESVTLSSDEMKPFIWMTTDTFIVERHPEFAEHLSKIAD